MHRVRIFADQRVGVRIAWNTFPVNCSGYLKMLYPYLRTFYRLEITRWIENWRNNYTDYGNNKYVQNLHFDFFGILCAMILVHVLLNGRFIISSKVTLLTLSIPLLMDPLNMRLQEKLYKFSDLRNIYMFLEMNTKLDSFNPIVSPMISK